MSPHFREYYGSSATPVTSTFKKERKRLRIRPVASSVHVGPCRTLLSLARRRIILPRQAPPRGGRVSAQCASTPEAFHVPFCGQAVATAIALTVIITVTASVRLTITVILVLVVSPCRRARCLSPGLLSPSLSSSRDHRCRPRLPRRPCHLRPRDKN